MSNKRANTTFKTSLLNDCTNHLSFQLGQQKTQNKNQQEKKTATYETPINNIVTSEYVRGYN